MERPAPRIVAPGAALLLILYLLYWFIGRPELEQLLRLWPLPAVGVIGAVIANTSGTGGGVVFVPVFNALRELSVLDLSPVQVTAASFGIQSMGMSMGALRWTDRLLHQRHYALLPGHAWVERRDFVKVVSAVLVLSLPAMLATQRLARFDSHDVLMAYKLFSIVLGTALVILTWTINRNRPEKARLEPVDLAAIMLLAIPGGFITAQFSVGIGELVALYLFCRHYPVLLCTGAACVISAVSVLAGLPFHIAAGNVPWAVVLLAGPGAALGGFLARPVALFLGARRLKTCDGLWIVCSAVYLLYLGRR
ncbi:hypothetical protein GCM10011494_38240 [Novosphingobium endophyticum]|uniref:Probable membrane transporter protein n=1 Tax=Novosphingobium endophyticum TaxID=1955250 RepID=A0A916TX38_9SPHN|nr:sulfite exporter TauE/SafE family protein [Novosphingobium endophyticum]GGC15705.1 hypothetical protein GCM10011494_38240 [Novosphingobium endophyticum]